MVSKALSRFRWRSTRRCYEGKVLTDTRSGWVNAHCEPMSSIRDLEHHITFGLMGVFTSTGSVTLKKNDSCLRAAVLVPDAHAICRYFGLFLSIQTLVLCFFLRCRYFFSFPLFRPYSPFSVSLSRTRIPLSLSLSLFSLSPWLVKSRAGRTVGGEG